MATLYKYRMDGATGRAAIFTVDSSNILDDAPLTDRLNHASRLRMHTDQPHVGVLTEMSGSVTIGQDTLTTAPTVRVLAAHGQPHTPSFLMNFSATQQDGIVRSGPMIGSQPFTVWPAQGRNVFLSVGADATNLFLNIYTDGSASPPSTPAQIGNFPFTFYWSALILDVGFNGAGAVVPKGGGPELFKMTDEYVIASGGAFDTRRRYMYESGSGNYVIPTGRTLDVWIGIIYSNNGRYHCHIVSPTYGSVGNYSAHPNGLLSSPLQAYSAANITPVTMMRVRI